MVMNTHTRQWSGAQIDSEAAADTEDTSVPATARKILFREIAPLLSFAHHTRKFTRSDASLPLIEPVELALSVIPKVRCDRHQLNIRIENDLSLGKLKPRLFMEAVHGLRIPRHKLPLERAHGAAQRFRDNFEAQLHVAMQSAKDVVHHLRAFFKLRIFATCYEGRPQSTNSLDRMLLHGRKFSLWSPRHWSSLTQAFAGD
jgi:hypothetical protein